MRWTKSTTRIQKVEIQIQSVARRASEINRYFQNPGVNSCSWNYSILAVTSELTSALQMNIVGQTQNIYTVMEHCKHIYPTLFESTSSEIHDNFKSCNGNIYSNIEMKQEQFDDDMTIKIEKY